MWKMEKNEKEPEEKLDLEQVPFRQEVLVKYLEAFRKFLAKSKRTYGMISGMRLVVFLCVVIGLLFALAADLWWGWLLSGIAVLAFIGLMFYHAEVGNHQNYVERLILVYERYQMRLQDEWKTFSDTGMEYQREQDYVSADLDVFGIGSLYQMLCVAHTTSGKRRLAEVLQQKEETVEILEQRQKAVAELAEKTQFSLHFEALAFGCEEERQKRREEDRPEVGQEYKKKSQESRFSIVLQILSWIYPVAFAMSIVGAIVQWWSSGVILVLFFGGLLLSWIMGGYCQRIVGGLFQRSHIMQNYLYMMEAVAVEKLESSYLKDLQKIIVGGENKKENLMTGLRKMEHLLAAYNIRYNPIVHWILSGICLYDFHLAAHAAVWERKYGNCLEQGLDALGEVEMLSSLAVLQRIRKVSYPVFVEHTSPTLCMKQIYHPLLAADTAIANDISLEKKSVIITGSNMSGKTTFLRTIGLNLLLAYAGAPVCGDIVSVSQMRIFTSMRVMDDVKHGISTFYAEILRIKEMVEFGKQGLPMLCLIDEIFKGTNSADRIVGAEAVIRKLSDDYMITIVSTHDFELCKLAENYHFEEYYKQNQIYFDYKLKEGMCTTTNALFLLKMAGLTE